MLTCRENPSRVRPCQNRCFLEQVWTLIQFSRWDRRLKRRISKGRRSRSRYSLIKSYVRLPAIFLSSEKLALFSLDMAFMTKIAAVKISAPKSYEANAQTEGDSQFAHLDGFLFAPLVHSRKVTAEELNASPLAIAKLTSASAFRSPQANPRPSASSADADELSSAMVVRAGGSEADIFTDLLMLFYGDS